jgi:hypothetical protein
MRVDAKSMAVIAASAAVAVAALGFAYGANQHVVVSAGQPVLYTVNGLTGVVRYCVPSGCARIDPPIPQDAVVPNDFFLTPSQNPPKK